MLTKLKRYFNLNPQLFFTLPKKDSFYQRCHPYNIGVFLGSFNPAHLGHLHLSKYALKKMNLEEIWWLITPQNPHKLGNNFLNLTERVNKAKEITKNDSRKIKIVVIEDKILALLANQEQVKKNYSVNTIKFLNQRYPQLNFIWLMGDDNLQSLSKWYCIEEIKKNAELAMFTRPNQNENKVRSLNTKFALVNRAYFKFNNRKNIINTNKTQVNEFKQSNRLKFFQRKKNRPLINQRSKIINHKRIPISRLNQPNYFKGEGRAAYIDIGERSETRKNVSNHVKMGFGITYLTIPLNYLSSTKIRNQGE